ncbi:MAG: tyrosine--tRNA ligase [Candidatus Aenigmarchaeota archaeon]|nr:tyrosine--tRNA ligase [Candidatus Aenigmarchaeota archaeon]
MDLEKRLELIKSVGEEIVTEEELKILLETNQHPIVYDGFEPSGQMHIAQGIMRAINTNKLLEAGCKFKFWVADWFAWMNNKMGGDMEKISVAGEYFIEVWKACGMDTKKVEFIWSKQAMGNEAYWKRVVSIAREITLNRVLRTVQIMGRSEKDTLSAAQILYPCMQASDIFELDVDITNLGMDQRKVNILAREIAPKLGLKKPVVVNYHMLMGLTAPSANINDPMERKIAMKMSKSIPSSAIFMTDASDEIKKKIRSAYCPEKQIDENPILEYCKYIIFEKFKEMKIERPEKFGGDVVYANYGDLQKAFLEGKLFPLDLKNSVATHIDKLIEPVRKHFENNSRAKELHETVKNIKITR